MLNLYKGLNNMKKRVRYPDVPDMQQYFDFYDQEILPHIQSCTTQNPNGCHALDKHTSSVVFRGIDYALSLDENPVPVIFACAFHDMARTDDGLDISHGKKAIPNALRIMDDFTKVLSQSDQDSIIFAIENHTIGKIAPDYVSACLWDADRTRMAWMYGYHKRFFNTKRGRYVASQPYQEYIKFQSLCFPQKFWSYEY